MAVVNDEAEEEVVAVANVENQGSPETMQGMNIVNVIVMTELEGERVTKRILGPFGDGPYAFLSYYF